MERYSALILIALIILLTFCLGFVAVFVDNSIFLTILSILIMTLITLLCIMDARKNNVSLPWSTYWLLFFFWLIAVPVYIFYSRKGIRKLKAFACFILYVIFLYSFPFICLYYLPSLAYYAHDSGLHKIALWLYSRDIYFYDDAWAYYNRACLYQEMGMESESEKDYKKAKKLDPSLFENE